MQDNYYQIEYKKENTSGLTKLDLLQEGQVDWTFENQLIRFTTLIQQGRSNINHLNRCKESISQNLTPMHNKNSCKLEIEVHSLNLVKGFYTNPIDQEKDKNIPIIASTQHYIAGPSQYNEINAIM